MSSRRRSQTLKGGGGGGRGKHRKKVDVCEEDEIVNVIDDIVNFPAEVPIDLSDTLKEQLEQDCIQICSKHSLLKLPASQSVCTLLLKFYSFCMDSKPDTNLPLLREVLDGLKTYFDVTLSTHLLYSEEKEQFEQIVEAYRVSNEGLLLNGYSDCSTVGVDENVFEPSNVYGPHHFLRLFVKLPMFLSRARIPEKHIQELHLHLKEILEYMSANSKDLFSSGSYVDQASAGFTPADVPL